MKKDNATVKPEVLTEEPTPAETAAKPVNSTKLAKSKVEPIVGYDPSNGGLSIGESVGKLVASLSEMSDEQLKQMFASALDSERALFVVRGAIAHELYRRATADGQEFDKSKGGGVNALIAEIAKDVGVDAKTLYTDFKVFEEFGGLLLEQLTTAPEALLPREYYVLATKTTRQAQELPMSVLEYFTEQRESTGGYFTDHARRDTKLFNEGRTVDEVKKLDAAERKAHIAGKGKDKAPAQAKESFVTVNLVNNPQNLDWFKLVVEKYGTFSEFFTRKCREEFGDTVDLPEPKATVNKKGKRANG